MKIEGPLIPGRFVERPNRFVTLVNMDGQLVQSHLPDPGRLKELLLPEAELLLRPAGKDSTRSTRFTTVMVRANGVLISLVSVLPNRFVRESLESGGLPMLSGFTLTRQEVSLGRHRFDFLLRDPQGTPFYLEVKSVTFVDNGIARFPDAVTLRGRRHVQALAELVGKGLGAGVLFVCQRHDADSFQPMWDRDPAFSEALHTAHAAGVAVWCITVKVTEREMNYYREIPVNLNLEVPQDIRFGQGVL